MDFHTFGLFLFLSICSISGLIVSKSVVPTQWQVNGHHTQFEKFGFGDGGFVSIMGSKIPEKNTFIYICDQTEHQQRLRMDNWINWLCGDHATGYKVFLTGELKNFTIKKDLYYFSIIDCTDNSFEVKVSYTLLSTKDGNHLSYDEIPFPLFYLALIAAWILLLSGWIIGLCRDKDLRSPLHSIILIVVLLKVLILGIVTFYWWVYSLTGHRYDMLNTLQNFLFSLSETAFFGTLFLISKGWRIVRSGLPAAEIRSTFIALFILLCTLLFFSFYNTDYYWLSLILMYFFMLPKIFTSLTQNMRLLDSQLHLFSQTLSRNTNLSEETQRFINLLKEKRDIFGKIRTFLVGYLILMLLVNSLIRVLLIWEIIWVAKVSNELIVFILVLYVVIRLRPSQRVFYLSVEEMRPLVALQTFLQNRGGALGYEEENSEREEEWDVSKTLAVLWPRRGKKSRDLTRMPIALAYESEYCALQKLKELM